MKVSVASVAYPDSTDAQARADLAQKLRELAECYANLAERAMSRGDRHGVYDCVVKERESHARAHRVEKGYVRF